MKEITSDLKDFRRSILLGAATGVVLALIFVAGFFFRDLVGSPSVFAASVDPTTNGYPLVDEVQNLLDRHYLREQPSYTERQYSAIRGLLEGLGDRYTFFIEPPVAQSESDVLAGTYGGIGVQLQRSQTGEFLLFPFPDGPARSAGVSDGDVLLQVDDLEITMDLQQDAVDQLLRGEVAEGNGVEITARHSGEDGEVYTVFIPFDVINVPSVIWRVLDEDPRIGYMHVLRFTNRTPSEVDEALRELRDSGAVGLILDLRDNNGGLLRESVDVASRFLDGGIVLYEISNDDERVFNAEDGGPWSEQPLVVLVNGGTASAAELVAGAIRDRDRAILIGQTTFGKGTVQQIFRLSDESSIHITSAEWFTPTRNTLDGTGLEPDIAMIPDENGRDVELGEAIRQLQQQLQEGSND